MLSYRAEKKNNLLSEQIIDLQSGADKLVDF
jgi:hypothetical protein